jgi:hypothetical protein
MYLETWAAFHLGKLGSEVKEKKFCPPFKKRANKKKTGILSLICKRRFNVLLVADQKKKPHHFIKLYKKGLGPLECDTARSTVSARDPKILLSHTSHWPLKKQ